MIDPRATSLGAALWDAALAYRDLPALVEVNRHTETRRLTFGQAAAEARRVSALLSRHGIGESARVAIALSNQWRWTVSAVGSLWSGHALVPVDARASEADLAAMLTRARADALVVEWPLWRRLVQQGSRWPRAFVTEAPAGADLGGAVRWEEPADAARFRLVPRRPEDVACIVHSSGTSEVPRACVLLHGSYLSQGRALARRFPSGPEDRYFSLLPTHHAIDFMVGFLLSWMCGSTVIHQRVLRPEFILSTMRQYEVTQMASVPLVLQAIDRRIAERIEALGAPIRLLHDALRATHERWSRDRPRPALTSALMGHVRRQLGGSLRRVFAGGAHVDASLAASLRAVGVPVLIGYGLTEACVVVAVNPEDAPRVDTVGTLVDGVEVSIGVSDDGGPGEVRVRGESVMAGYLDEPEGTARVLRGGWLHTGDLGVFEPDGHLRLVGRAKDVIVTLGGKKVIPELVERALAEGLPDRDVCVLGESALGPMRALADASLVAVVDARDIAAGEVEAALRQANRVLPAYARISAWVPWSEPFPRTTSLKLRRAALVGELRAAGAAPRPITAR